MMSYRIEACGHFSEARELDRDEFIFIPFLLQACTTFEKCPAVRIQGPGVVPAGHSVHEEDVPGC